MSLDADVRRLAGVKPFDALPREALQLLAFSCAKRRLGEGEALFAAGEPADGGYFVLDGEIAMNDGATERRVGAGALIGEMALLAETIRPAAAAATRESLVLHVPRETFRRVLSEFPEAAAKIHRAAARRARGLVSALDSLRRRGFLAAP